MEAVNKVKRSDYEETRKFLMMQDNNDEILDSIKPIINNEECLTFMVLNAYHLGVISGKRQERSRRARR